MQPAAALGWGDMDSTHCPYIMHLSPHGCYSPRALLPISRPRNWIAIKEGFEGTWLNPIPALVRQYSADGAGVLTADELAAVPGAHRYVAGLYFSTVTIATLGYGGLGQPRMRMS